MLKLRIVKNTGQEEEEEEEEEEVSIKGLVMLLTIIVKFGQLTKSKAKSTHRPRRCI